LPSSTKLEMARKELKARFSCTRSSPFFTAPQQPLLGLSFLWKGGQQAQSGVAFSSNYDIINKGEILLLKLILIFYTISNNASFAVIAPFSLEGTLPKPLPISLEKQILTITTNRIQAINTAIEVHFVRLIATNSRE
jgi:hypothetical protein